MIILLASIGMMVMAVMVMVMMVHDYDHLGLGCDRSQAAKEDQSEQNLFHHSACRMRLIDQQPYPKADRPQALTRDPSRSEN
jgi:hypothetical protein